MSEFEGRAVALIQTLQRILQAQRRRHEASLLAEANPSLLQTGYDNLDGGTYTWRLVLQVPVDVFAQLGASQASVEQKILEGVRPLLRNQAGNWIEEVVIVPELESEADVSDSLQESAPEPTFWTPGFVRVFISHSSAIKAKAHALKSALLSEGIVGFVAHDDIEPAREWMLEIEAALRTMDALAALVSPEFVESRWCDQEVGIAIGKGRLVIPVRLGADPHGFMGKFQGIQAKGKKPAEVAAAIADALLKSESTSQRMAEPIVAALESSSSWEQSRILIGQLEKAVMLTPDQLDRVLLALEANGEVKYSHTVPERIAKLVEKFRK